ncbi:MAG TPA: hypothetical protein VNJ09_04355 [Chthonomonadales bacterium]|nr:hypothetical protein [Chthonomonadales bacterium]
MSSFICRSRQFAILAIIIVTGLMCGCRGGNEKPAVVLKPTSEESFQNVPAPGKPIPNQPPTDDPKVALQRMVAAYKSLDSLYVRTEADILKVRGKNSRLAYQIAITRFRKSPPRFSMVVMDPHAGTQFFVSDGSNIVWHLGLTNQFLRREFRGDLAALCRQVDKDAPQLLTPTVFLRSDKFPLGIGPIRMAGIDTVDGKPAYKISGQFAPEYLRDYAKRLYGGEVEPTHREFTLWLDKHNYLVLMTRMHVGWSGKLERRRQKPVPFDLQAKVTERVTILVQNPRFTEDDFRYVAPKGAQEVFVESRSQ